MQIGSVWARLGLDSADFQRGLDDSRSALGAFKDDALRVAGAIGAGVGAALGASLYGAIALEPARDKLSAQLGLTGQDAARAGEAAGMLFSNNWGDSMDDAAARTGAVMSSIDGMRTATAEAISDMTARVSIVGDTYDIEAARIAQVTGQMVRTGMVKNAEEGLDDLAVVLSQVPANVREDVLDAIDEYGPMFSQLGIDGETALRMLAKGGEMGAIGIDKTGDALKELTIRATDGSAVDAFKAIGLSADEMGAAISRGGDDAAVATGKIVDGLLGIEDPLKQQQAAIALFGTPFEDLAAEQIPGFLEGLRVTEDALGDTSGAVDQMGATLTDNASSNLEWFKRQAISLAIDTIGGALIPKVAEVAEVLATEFGPTVEWAGGVLAEFAGWVQENKSWLIPLGAALAMVAAEILVMAAAAQIVAAGGLVAFIKTVVTSTRLWALAQAALNLVMSANPLMLVVMGIGAIVAAFIAAYHSSETFRNVVDGVFSWLKEAATAIGDWFTGDFVQFFKDAWQWVKDTATDAKDWVVNSARDLKDGVIRFITDMVLGFVQLNMDMLATARQVWDWIYDHTVGSVKRIVSNGMNSLTELYNWWVGWGVRIKAYLSGLWNDIKETGLYYIWLLRTGIEDKFNEIVDAAGRVFNNLPEKLKSPITTAVKWINDTFIGGINGMLSKLNIEWSIPVIPGFREGGRVQGRYVSDTADSELIRANPGEMVVRNSSVRKLDAAHPGLLEHLNRYGSLPEGLPRFAEGGIVQRYLAKMATRIGAPYVWGAGHSASQQRNPNQWAFDCSGLGLWTETQLGVPHTGGVARDMGGRAKAIGRQAAINTPGAYLWHSGHIGYSLGDGRMIEAPRTGLNVRIAPVRSSLVNGSINPALINGGAFAGVGEGGSSDGGVFASLVQGLLDKFEAPSPWGDVIKAALVKVPQAVADKVTSLVSSIFTGGGDAGDDAAGGGKFGQKVERWRPLVLRALNFVGQAASLADTTLRRMKKESGGDERAINNWDSNAKKGTPSKGLMQVIDPTFKANARSPYNKDIWDPMSNVTASMFYTLRRYGSLPAGYNRSGGYYRGTLNASEGLHALGETGPELVLSPRYGHLTAGSKVLPLAGASGGVSAEAIREALDGMAIDLDNGRVFFRRQYAQVKADERRLARAGSGDVG